MTSWTNSNINKNTQTISTWSSLHFYASNFIQKLKEPLQKSNKKQLSQIRKSLPLTSTYTATACRNISTFVLIGVKLSNLIANDRLGDISANLDHSRFALKKGSWSLLLLLLGSPVPTVKSFPHF